jgi:hypothetical protein
MTQEIKKSDDAAAKPPSAARKPRLMDVSERIAAYGLPAENIRGKLVPDVQWERESIVPVRLPWLMSNGKVMRVMRVHKRTVDQWSQLFSAWSDAKLLDRVLTYNGAYNCRMKRGYEQSTELKDLSTHAFGAAMDINAPWNPLGKQPAPEYERGSLVELVPIAYACGFVWGGDFHRPDGMHFEIGV